MDYKKIDEIVKECLEYDIYTDVVDEFFNDVVPLCKKIISEEKIIILSQDFSTDYSLNDKLKLISNFFKVIDTDLYNQFETIISSVDENGKPLINFVYNDDIGSSKNDYKTSKVYINLANNLQDLFVIIHEIIHYMNHYIIEIEEDNKIDFDISHFKYLYEESAPIIAEKLFGHWLIKEGYITENDFKKVESRRINSTINIAWFLVIESEYARLKQKGIEITKESLEKRMKELGDDPITQMILSKEIKDGRIGKSIIESKMLKFPKMQKYILAYEKQKKYKLDKNSIEEFLELNKDLSNPNIKK